MTECVSAGQDVCLCVGLGRGAGASLAAGRRVLQLHGATLRPAPAGRQLPAHADRAGPQAAAPRDQGQQPMDVKQHRKYGPYLQ